MQRLKFALWKPLQSCLIFFFFRVTMASAIKKTGMQSMCGQNGSGKQSPGWDRGVGLTNVPFTDSKRSSERSLKVSHSAELRSIRTSTLVWFLFFLSTIFMYKLEFEPPPWHLCVCEAFLEITSSVYHAFWIENNPRNTWDASTARFFD